MPDITLVPEGWRPASLPRRAIVRPSWLGWRITRQVGTTQVGESSVFRFTRRGAERVARRWEKFGA